MLQTNKGKRRLAKGTMLDLEFWRMIITSDLLSTGIQMDSYCDESIPQVGINMDASDTGLCASDQAIKEFVRIDFNTTELEAVRRFKEHGGHHAFNINVRELLSCLYATIVWGER